MNPSASIYDWRQISDLDKRSMGRTAGGELFVDLSAIGCLHDQASDDPELLVLWQVDTPFGHNSRMKSDPIRFLQWLLMFRCFQRAAHRSFQMEEFQRYARQEPWYLIVGEHDQIQCLVAEVAGPGPVSPIPVDTVAAMSPRSSLYDNIERLVSNRQVETLTERYLSWLHSTGRFERYLDMVDAIPLEGIESQLLEVLVNHYGTAGSNPAGGISFEWSAGRSGERQAYGSAFRYSVPIGQVGNH